MSVMSRIILKKGTNAAQNSIQKLAVKALVIINIFTWCLIYKTNVCSVIVLPLTWGLVTCEGLWWRTLYFPLSVAWADTVAGRNFHQVIFLCTWIRICPLCRLKKRKLFLTCNQWSPWTLLITLISNAWTLPSDIAVETLKLLSVQLSEQKKT